MSSAKWRPFCLGFNVLINNCYVIYKVIIVELELTITAFHIEN